MKKVFVLLVIIISALDIYYLYIFISNYPLKGEYNINTIRSAFFDIKPINVVLSCIILSVISIVLIVAQELFPNKIIKWSFIVVLFFSMFLILFPLM